MMTMKCKTAAAAPMAVRAIHASAAVSAPAKPMAVSHTLHAPAHVKVNNSAQQAAEAKLALRDRVVLEHLPLVKAIAIRVHENLPVHVDVDDLVHSGVLGLFDAASKYNPDKQVAFSSYAKHRIKGAILDSLRQLDWASRDMRRRHKQVEAATRELAATLQRNPGHQRESRFPDPQGGVREDAGGAADQRHHVKPSVLKAGPGCCGKIAT